MIDSPPASPRARRPGLRAFTVLSFVVLGPGQASALPQVQMEPWPGFLLAQAAEPAEPTIPREQPGAEQQVPVTELNEVLEVLEATRTKLEELFGATEGMQQALQRSSAEAQRLNSELAATKGQLGEATTAGAEAERAHQLAVSEAQQLRGEAERANAELVAARKETERFKAANGELEQQIASLNAESKSAIDTARQTLTVMEEKIGELNAALAGAGLIETRPAQADDASRLMRFDANVRYLNSRSLGADLFSGIESPGDGVVLVSTTAAWQSISPAGQRRYLNSLFNLWSVAQEGSGPTVVRIVDPRGRVLLEKSDRD